MKQSILALILSSVSLFSSAQTTTPLTTPSTPPPVMQTRVAYINTNELVALMPATDSAMKKLTKIRDQWQAELQYLQTNYQTKLKEYNQLLNVPDVHPARLELRQRELVELEDKIKNMQVYAQQDIQAKEQEYFDPIVKRVKAAIQRVAIERGYDFVLDSSEGYNVLYCNPAHDLMMAVRTELRIPVNAKPIQMDQGY